MSILKERFPAKAIIALTATADKQTRSDICAQLQIADNNVFIDSFDRPNLSLNVLPATNRYKKILEILKTKPFESGIIYCLSRKSTESLAEKLQNDGFKAAFYHAGLTAENRNTIQNDFSTDKIQLICATIAFGMGIDKSNIRWVIHYNLPKNIEGYYQEIGRAGRDGAESDTYLFYSYGDLVTLKQFALSSGQAEIQEAKLESMQQYAEANTCRRKILLSYFNEIIEENCNNCDVCQNPPNTFDATLIAQKALSASYRLEQKVAAGLLIDVLRGSNKQEIIQNQMHTIKTYGAGKDISYFDWQNYILQMVHQGVFEIDFAHKQQLKITPLGNKVLFDKKALYLVKPVAFQTKAVPKIKEENTGQTENAALLEKLKIKRKELAQDNNIPAYLIFNDKTLKDMVMKMPISPFEMLQVSGVGENKLQLYGDMFISIILEHKASNNAFKKSKIATHLQTYQLINEGKTIAEIGQIRQVNESTIIAHLLKCHQEKLTIDWYKYITRVEVAKIIMVAKTCKEKEGLKEIFEKMNGEFSYDKIKIALALANE